MHILVIYDDGAARRQAILLRERLQRFLGRDCEFEFVWSQIQQLQDNQFVAEAVSVAQESDLVIVALSNAAWVSRGFRHWVAGWERRPLNKQSAIALLTDQSSKHTSRDQLPIVRALKRLADSCGIPFTHSEFVSPERGKPAGDEGKPQSRGSEMVRRIRDDLTMAEAPVRWGINE